MKILKTLYYEIVVEHFVEKFIFWLGNEGYETECNAMCEAMLSWSNKTLQRLKAGESK